MKTLGRTAASIILLGLFSLTAPAQVSGSGDGDAAWPMAGSAGYATDLYYVETPDQVIRRAVDRLAGYLEAASQATPSEVLAFVTRHIAPYFDFRYMAEWASGPLRHRLTPPQQAALARRLEQMFLDALARNLGTLERPLPRVEVFPARPGRNLSDAVVYARVLGAQLHTRLEFRFYWDGYQWRIYDAAANGASATAYYRQYFTTMLRRYGPDALLR